MKKIHLLLLSFALTSCNSFSSNESTNSENETSSSVFESSISSNESETSTSIEESSSSSVEETSSESFDLPTQYIDLNQNEVVNIYRDNFEIKQNCYLVLDNQGRIVFGTDKKSNTIGCSFYSNIVKNNMVQMKDDLCGYLVLDDTYASIINEIIDIDYVGINYVKNDVEVMNKSAFRLSSITDIADDDGLVTYKTYAPYEDTYTVTYSKASFVKVFDASYKLIASGTTKATVNLSKNEVAYVQIKSAVNKAFNLIAYPNNHPIELPYEVINDNTKYDVNGNDAFKPAEIKYTKRSDSRSLYVNCNNPEALTENELNKCLTKQDVTNKDVFFTFEHNNINTTSYYYGYRVTNTSNEDIYVTVKNLGYQCSGAGTWLGEDEWVKFYNISFRSKKDFGSASANANLEAYVGFCNTYDSENRKPITYRIPKGKYIYVMGGTTADAYNKTNVFKSANIQVKGACGNGAVLFSVNGGSALGQFVVYNNVSTLEKNINNENGYVVTRDGKNVGSQYVGYDTCHGVVDGNISWIINDSTTNGNLPVTYTNPYYATVHSGAAYSTITSIQGNKNNANNWVTHINPNHTKEAVGTDMTYYKTIDNVTRKEIIIDCNHYDGKGKTANIGNWMVDYQDHFTIVNQGSKTREFTYKMRHNGVILGFVRNEEGYIDPGFTPKYFIRLSASSYGAECKDLFEYSIVLAPHSVTRFTVDYNLLANASGYILHEAVLGTI